MTFDPVTSTPLAGMALSGGASLGAFWASLRNTAQRVLLVAIAWLLASLGLWSLTISRLDWARSYLFELLTLQIASSLVPAGVAFALTRRATHMSRRLYIVGAVTLVALLWVVCALPSAVYTSCMLDTQCY